MQEVENSIKEKREFIALKAGNLYRLPTYKIVPGKGIERSGRELLVPFVRGSKKIEENEYPPVEGIVHESLLSMQIYDLELKNAEFPNEYTPQVIEHLQAARNILEARTRERAERNVLGKYEK
jgi:hypothetical protein